MTPQEQGAIAADVVAEMDTSKPALMKLGRLYHSRREACRTCPTPCKPLPVITDESAKCPLEPSRWPDGSGLGSLLEMIAKPIAVSLKLKCVDEKGALRPDSGCAQRRDWLNRRFPAK